MSVVSFNGATVKHEIASDERIRSSKTGTKLDMTEFQSKQLRYVRSGDRTIDFKHSSTMTTPLTLTTVFFSFVHQQHLNIPFTTPPSSHLICVFIKDGSQDNSNRLVRSSD